MNRRDMHKKNKRRAIKAAERLEKELRRFSNTMKIIHDDEVLWLGDHLAPVIKQASLLAGRARSIIKAPHKYFAYWKDE